MSSILTKEIYTIKCITCNYYDYYLPAKHDCYKINENFESIEDSTKKYITDCKFSTFCSQKIINSKSIFFINHFVFFF